MASRKDNLKALFTNTRSRVIIVFTTVLLIIAVVIGYFKFSSVTNPELSSAALTGVPGIESTPGSLNPSPEYAKLQLKQNVDQAKEAMEKGGSAIPTIIRTQEIGEGTKSIVRPGEGGIGFVSLAQVDETAGQKSLWIQNLKDANCNQQTLQKIINQGAQLSEIRSACSCSQLKQGGYSLAELKDSCPCKELKQSGVTATQLRESGYTAGQLRDCGFSGCEVKAAGYSALEMKDGGFTDGELKGAGFSDQDIAAASGIPDGMSAVDVLKAGCDVNALSQLRARGVTAAAIRRISGCSATQLKQAGFTAQDLRNAGFTAAELRNAGFSLEDLKNAGFNARDLLMAGFSPEELIKAGFDARAVNALAAELDLANPKFPKDCSVAELTKARLNGISARTIREKLGCSAAAMKAAGFTAAALKDAGYTAAELKNAGFTAKELKDAGFSAKELKDAGFSAGELKDAGFSARQLKDAGFTAAELKNAGFSARELKDAGFDAKALKDAGFTANELKALGFSAKDLKDAGFTAGELRAAGFSLGELKDAGFTAEALRKAGFSARDLQRAGFTNSQIKEAGFRNAELRSIGLSAVQGLPEDEITGMDSELAAIAGQKGPSSAAAQEAANARQLQAIMDAQNKRVANQQFQQQIQQRTADMMGEANSSIQNWSRVSTQVFNGTAEITEKKSVTTETTVEGVSRTVTHESSRTVTKTSALILTGDIVFAVIDTAVDTDEPGPILATIVSGKLKGGKLIGSFVLPNDAGKMVINFNTLSMPGSAHSIPVAAYAIDPDTGRTALSSSTNKHYFVKYGALFASSFLEGFGNAFQSANTTVTVGGTGGGGNVTIQNGIGRSALENAVIGLATVGKNWGQFAQQQMNKPATVRVYSGTAIGVLFTQDLASL